MATPDPLHRTAYGLAAVWIFGGALYFYAHFTQVFYEANQSAFEILWERMRAFLTLG